MQMEEMKPDGSVKPTGESQHNQLNTDKPLAEKDEVKGAEKRTRKALKDHL